MYLEIFLADFAVFRVFLGISRDFAEIPEFRGSVTARNIRSPDLRRPSTNPSQEIHHAMWHSNIFNLLGTRKSFLILYNQKIHKLGIPMYLYIKMLHYTMWRGCPLLVFTKSVDSDLRVFWLAPLTRNILGYSLFWDSKWLLVSRQFQKIKF